MLPPKADFGWPPERAVSGRDLGTAVTDAPELDREVGACCKALPVLRGVPG